MVAVDIVDGIKYGFRLLGYLVVVAIAGGVLFLVGAGFAPGPFDRGNPILMLLFVLAGMAVFYAGGLGMLYKVIADGVETGTLAAEYDGAGGTQQPPQGPTGGAHQAPAQQPRGGQQQAPPQQGANQQANTQQGRNQQS